MTTAPENTPAPLRPGAVRAYRINEGAVYLIRRRIRQALHQSIHTDMDFLGGLHEVEDEVMRALLDDPEIAWALAYVAGVQMAPALLKDMRVPRPIPSDIPAPGSSENEAHTPPPNPSGEGGR